MRSEPSGTVAAIEVDGLRQSYGDFEAVRGISFTVRQGELFALLGTNGAGKTTTMECLEGFTRAREGDVRVLGFDPHRERRELRPRIGVMLQEGGFLGDLTVAETIGVWRGMASDAGRSSIDGALELVGLTAKARTRVRQLSGGQRRRLDLALAVLARPDVLFLDEPTTGMDPEARRDTWRVIHDLKDSGTTVLLTTHYLEEAERLADHLAIMHEGLISATGTVDDVVGLAGDHIRFRLPLSPGALRERLPEGLPFLEGAAATTTHTEHGTRVGYELPASPSAGRAQAAMRPLLDWADKHAMTLEHLEVRRGTLEDVFLRVVGEGRG
ncbi:ABC transporter ATP-binding protein [Spongiactinospora sp. TRM90649]|uniref:ABC transporter ATP-binding protein n=1 Tax=Spongiactinospora sp. TRM90649 TaxID=3031114 RepID=UPI0023F6A614|nr:ABC transporter ATP-binding protein [Spongiactinospora sp. TRM90649]MDF5752555.1 ABC transporter ATP-binding protein [Spongiactinospora sp. TRM90649]